jgi:hypothetical protein
MSSMMMIERRRLPRYPLVLVALVEHIDPSTTTLRGLTSDVGRGGCFIDALNPMLLGTQVRVRLRWGQEGFVTTGRVASVDRGRGMGIEFTKQMSLDQLDALGGWLVGRKSKE